MLEDKHKWLMLNHPHIWTRKLTPRTMTQTDKPVHGPAAHPQTNHQEDHPEMTEDIWC